ncbi:hypothetical protein Tco_1556909 [Tanacetum coccineum]
MHDKMKDPKYVTHKVKIAPPDYSKENFFSDLHTTKAIDPRANILVSRHHQDESRSSQRADHSLKTNQSVDGLEAGVNQHVVDRKHDEIEQKNLLIANDNLIADCLSKEVFYIATNSELTVSRFIEMYEAHTIVQTRCLKLEA